MNNVTPPVLYISHIITYTDKSKYLNLNILSPLGVTWLNQTLSCFLFACLIAQSYDYEFFFFFKKHIHVDAFILTVFVLSYIVNVVQNLVTIYVQVMWLLKSLS